MFLNEGLLEATGPRWCEAVRLEVEGLVEVRFRALGCKVFVYGLFCSIQDGACFTASGLGLMRLRAEA